MTVMANVPLKPPGKTPAMVKCSPVWKPCGPAVVTMTVVPVSLMAEMESVCLTAPKVTLLSSSIRPDQVLLPTALSSAPAVWPVLARPDPFSFRCSGTLMPLTLLSCSWRRPAPS